MTTKAKVGDTVLVKAVVMAVYEGEDSVSINMTGKGNFGVLVPVDSVYAVVTQEEDPFTRLTTGKSLDLSAAEELCRRNGWTLVQLETESKEPEKK